MRRWVPCLAFLALAAFRPAAADDAGSPAVCPLDAAFLPKDDLRVPAFLAAHPEADGRGVVVAVLDTGVDPGHVRLARTSTGERKILDLLDATDDGIVETPIPVEVIDGAVVGATGRALDLGEHVRAGRPARLGRIDARSVLPAPLVERLRNRRRERLEEAARRLDGAPASPARAGEPQALLDARRAAEADLRRALPDETPAYDVLLVSTEAGPRAVIDTDADGDLAEERELADFGVAGDWVTLRDDAELNVGVRCEADLSRVRLLFDGGGHGTHVAGIVAGYEGPGSPWNGLAPGARILAIKVGNSRFGGPTTNLAIVRALEWAGQRGARVVNLSFGGAAFSGDAGTPDARAADEAVERHGLLCCFSAGNDGPTLGSVGSPATARRVLSVGAYVSPETMRAAYAQLGPSPGERLFGFSSRGPTPGGDLGVSVLAPGAAWSPVPAWQLVHSEKMNGTSMAAPQVSGAAALLLSAALVDGVPASPARMIRAIRASARPVPGLLPVEQGAGLLQVDRAYEVLASLRTTPPEGELRARVENATGTGGGIVDRGGAGDAPYDRDVDVSVVWPRGATNEARLAFERRLVLASDAPWVEVPPRLVLNAEGGSFSVRVDPRSLPEGVHGTVIHVRDPERVGVGDELTVPVTLVRPSPVLDDGRFSLSVTSAPGERVSRFVRVPSGASRVRLRATAGAGARNVYTFGLAAADAWRRPDERRAGARATLSAGDGVDLDATVVPGTVVEIVAFSHWNANQPGAIAIEGRFEGPVASDPEIRVGPGQDVALIRLASPLAPFQGRVEAVLDAVAEHPTVAREVRVEPGAVLGDERLRTIVQRFPVTVGSGEVVRLVALADPALDEQIEDARFIVRDAAGRAVRMEVVNGPLSLEGVPVGRYDVTFETPTWNRTSADTAIVGFEIRRRRGEARASVHPSADAAAEGRDGNDRLSWPAGAVRSVALRLPALEAGRVHLGTVRVLDAEGDVRLALPLLVDRTTKPAAADPVTAAAAHEAAMRSAVEAHVAAPWPEPTGAAAAAAHVARLLATRAGDLELEILALRVAASGPAVEASKTLSAPETARRIDAALARLDRARADDRPRIGRLLLLRSASRTGLGKTAEGKADLAEARFLLPEADPELLRLRRRLGLEPGGDLLDARAAAIALRDLDPTQVEGFLAVLELHVRLGWAIPASHDLRGFADRFPRRLAELPARARAVRAIGGHPAPRTLERLAEGAP